MTQSQQWYARVVSDTNKTLKMWGFKKAGKELWEASRPEVKMYASLQRSSSCRFNRLVWYFWIGLNCPAITIGEDFALPEWRGDSAGFGGRMYDPAGPVNDAHWDLMAIRYPEVPHPAGPYRREEWDIASEAEAEHTFLRYVHELESVALPEIESASS